MAKIAGLTLIAVRVADVKPNPWNPNKMNDETFEKERRSIREHGFIDPITVRELPDGTHQIIDGEHRWKGAAAEGIEEIPATNLGVISDHQAKKLTIIYNELRGAPEPLALAKVLQELSLEQPISDLALDLPMTSVEIDTLIKSVADYSFDLDSAPMQNNDEPRASTGAEGERKFTLGSVRGSLPVWLTDKLLEQFDLSAAAMRTRNPEIVLRDWCDRLQRTPSEARPLPAAPEATVAPAKAKRGARKATPAKET